MELEYSGGKKEVTAEEQIEQTVKPEKVETKPSVKAQSKQQVEENDDPTEETTGGTVKTAAQKKKEKKEREKQKKLQMKQKVLFSFSFIHLNQSKLYKLTNILGRW